MQAWFLANTELVMHTLFWNLNWICYLVATLKRTGEIKFYMYLSSAKPILHSLQI
jgi:hypothetical protein